MASEVEDTLKRIQSHRGVVGTIVVNNEGIPIKSTLDNSTSVQYAGLIQQLADKARSVVRDLDPSNDLMFLRMRTKKTRDNGGTRFVPHVEMKNQHRDEYRKTCSPIYIQKIYLHFTDSSLCVKIV